MFKLLKPHIDDLKLEPSILPLNTGIIDIQLFDDELAFDQTLVDEEGYKKIIDNIPQYSQRSLSEKLPNEKLSQIFNQLTNLLIQLAKNRDMLLFLRHPPDNFDRSEYDEFYSISAYCDNGLLNGNIDIVRLSCAELWGNLEIWGQFDSVQGVVLDPNIPTASILTHCTLVSPEPTTVQRFDQRTAGCSSLVSILPHVAFFFEEIKNSTCLRIINSHLNQNQLYELIKKTSTF